MQTVLNAPVASDQAVELLGRKLQVAQVVAHLGADLIADLAAGLYLDDAVEVLPTGQPAVKPQVGLHIAAAAFDAPAAEIKCSKLARTSFLTYIRSLTCS